MIKEKYAPTNSAVENITPEQALVYLEQMPRNRRLVQAKVDRLAKDMQDGLWMPELCDPLRFDTDGHLIDGQHRLWAVASTGLPFDFTIVRNLPTEAIYLIDSGKSRNLADALHINDEVDTACLSGAINFYSEWLVSGFIQKTSTRTTIVNGLRILGANPELRDGVRTGNVLRQTLKGGAGRWGAVVYILRSIDHDDADAFLQHLATGEDLHPAHPVLQLRRCLLDDTRSTRKMAIYQYTALVFKAWNMWRAGQTSPRKLTFRAGGRNPEAYPIPN